MATDVLTTKLFVNRFHELDGTTIGERRKNLSKLLQDYKNVTIDFDKLKPKNHLEEMFKIDVLTAYQNVSGILEVFQSENPALIKKVLKIQCLWSEMEAHTIKQIFPQISFNAKLKIINQVALHLKNTDEADSMFSYINQHYGMYLAVKLLPCCSYRIISENFIAGNVKHLKVRHILYILKKQPEIIELLLNEEFGFILHDKLIFKEIIDNHIDLFLKFYKPGTFFGYYVKLGRRATYRFMQIKKSFFMENVLHISSFLHEKKVLKMVGSDTSQYYTKMLPDYHEIKNNTNRYLDLLDKLKISQKYDFFATAFQNKYGINLIDSDVINVQLLELMNEQQRLYVAKRVDIPHIITICLKKTHESIPEIQKLISLSSNVETRSLLIADLVETCRINKDDTALINVCKYVYERHRNDNLSIFYSFFFALEKYDLTTLKEEHWLYVGKILKVVVGRDSMWFQYSKCLYAYTYFLYTQNVSLKPIARIYSKKSISLEHMVGYAGRTKLPPKFEKEFLCVLGEVLPEVYKDKELKTQYVSYLCQIQKWNKTHPKDKLPLLENKEGINALLEEWNQESYNHSCSLVLLHILHSKNVSDKSFWFDTYFKKKTYSDIVEMEWLVKYEPVIVRSKIEAIMDLILDMYYTQVHRFFFTMSRNYSHLELPQTIAEICKRVITSPEESETRKKNAITGLSYVTAQPQEFISLLEPYYPVDKTEPDAVVYVMQQNLSRSLGNVIPPSAMLQSVILFSKGDYTKFIRRSMYLIAFSTNESKVGHFLSEINSLAVSVRKHAIYLGFRVLSRNSIYDIIERNSTDKNTSIRKFLMRGIFTSFIKNPDNFKWDLLKNSIKNINVEDKEAFDVLVQLDKIPTSFLKRYIKLIAGYIDISDATADLIPDNVYASFESEFVMTLIDLNKCGDAFIRKCIVNMSDVQGLILSKVFMQRLPLNTASVFLQECASLFIAKSSSNITMLRKCSELLEMLQPSEKYLYDRLNLRLYELYVEFYLNEKSVPKFVESLVLITEGFVSKYKPVMFNKFCSVVAITLRMMLSFCELLDLIKRIIEGTNSAYGICVAIVLLPRSLPIEPNFRMEIFNIIERLQCSQIPLVKMFVSTYLNELMTQHAVVEVQPKNEPKYKNYFAMYYYSSSYTNAELVFE